MRPVKKHLLLVECMQIRSITSHDIFAIYHIEMLTASDPWQLSVFDEGFWRGYYGYAMEDETQLVGFCWLSDTLDECHLLNIAVLLEYRRQQIAKKLLQMVIATAKEKQCRRIMLEVRVSNVVAIALYEKMGFQCDGIRKKYYALPDGEEDAALYSLWLTTYDTITG